MHRLRIIGILFVVVVEGVGKKALVAFITAVRIAIVVAIAVVIVRDVIGQLRIVRVDRCRYRRRFPHRLHQQRNFVSTELLPAIAGQLARQAYRPEPHPHQTTDRQTHMLHEPAHLPVAPLTDHDAIPGIGTVTAKILDYRHRRGAIGEIDTFQQRLAGIVIDSAKHLDRIFTLPAIAGMHQLVGQITGSRENQQTLGIEVEPPD